MTMQLKHTKSVTTPDGSRVLFKMRMAGISVDTDGRLLVVGDDHLKRFAADGELDRQIELGGLGWCVHAEEDLLWVGMQGAIRRFDDQDQPAGTIRLERLGLITALAMVDDHLLAADATQRTIHRLTKAGEYLGQVGTKANTRGFLIPNGMLDLCGDKSNDTLLVAHPQKHRVERYNATGELIDKWGKFGMHAPQDFGGCCNPTCIAVAADGTIAVSEKAPPKVKLFSSKGEFLTLLESPLFSPQTANIRLAFDSAGHLYASDSVRLAIDQFTLSRDEASVP